jgi:MoaA/NifB/PqqE/SkfB family radical SAM enzyme
MNFIAQVRMGMGALRGALGARIPLNVMISVTDNCPSRCSYCSIPSRRRPDLATDDWKRLLLEMRRAGTMRIGVWGGEPMTRKDIVELCSHARDLGMYVSIDSNGYLIPSRREILDAVDHVVLSLDGPPHAHDANRELGSWLRTMEAVRFCSGKVRLWTITVLTKNNINELDWIMNTALEYGFMTTFQTLHHNDSLGGDTSAMRPSNDEYRQAFGRLLELKGKGAPIALSSSFLRKIAQWPDFTTTRLHEKFYGPGCSAGRMFCNIDADGRVYPCSLLIGEYPGALNALEAGFAKAFRAAGELPCQACTASCYPEYNYLYGLYPSVAMDWHRSVKTTDRLMKKAALNMRTPEE